jgi:hypothetical protein
MREEQQNSIIARGTIPQERLLTNSVLLAEASSLRRVTIHRHKCGRRRDAVEVLLGSHVAGARAPAPHRTLIRAQRQQPLPVGRPGQVADCSIVRCELQDDPCAAAGSSASRFRAA